MKWTRGALAGLATLVILAVSAPAANALAVHLPNGRFAGVWLRPGLSAAAYEHGTAARVQASVSRAAVCPASPDGLCWDGGPVLHTTSPYLVFWDPSGAITAQSRHVMTQYYIDASQDSSNPTDAYAYRILSQYTDSNGSAAQGQTFSAGTQAISDPDSYPSTDTTTCTAAEQQGFAQCITDAQIQAELTSLINSRHLPTGTGSGAPIYFVVTPQNVNVCMNGGGCASDTFCAYHSSYLGPGSNTVIYASIPFTSGAGCQDAGPVDPPTQEPNGDVADVITDNMSHENSEAVTDPLGTAWLTTTGEEVGDQCEAFGAYDPNDPRGPTNPDAYLPTLGGSQSAGTLYDQLINGDSYFTQTEWSNSTENCEATATITPSFTPPASVRPAMSASFDPTASTSTDGYTSTTWNWGDGSPNTVLSGAPAVTSHTYASAGTYTVTLTLVDAGGRTAHVSHTIMVGSPVTAAFSPSGTTTHVAGPVAFNAGGSTDPNSGQSIRTYSWSFGDGSPEGTGATPSHPYASPGTYTVTLTVTGSEGFTAMVSHTVNVIADPVAVPALTSAQPLAGSPASFGGGGSVGSIATYAWDFGDGGAGSGPTATHTYATSGIFTVSLTVTDVLGSSSTRSLTVAVDLPVAAAFSPSGTIAETGSPVAFAGGGSNDPNSGQSITAYSWDFGDGSSAGTGATPSHAYATPGTYTITLTVTGSEGLTASVSHTLTVVGAPVAIPALSTTHLVAGSPVSFNGSSSTGGISAYAWTFGDGATGSGASPSHTYARAGTYTVTLTVTDASGFTATRSLSVVVAKSPITTVSTKRVNGVYYLVVSVTQAGTVKVGSAKLALKRPGKATFKIVLSGAQKRRLGQGKTVSLNEQISFTPKHGPRLGKATTVKLKG